MIISNDNEGAEVGYKMQITNPPIFAYGILKIQSQLICESTISKKFFSLAFNRVNKATVRNNIRCMLTFQ